MSFIQPDSKHQLPISAAMKILEINSVPYGSTCNIMLGIHDVAEPIGIQVDTSSGYSTHPNRNLPKNHINIGGKLDKSLHMLLARLSGYNGCFSYLATKKLIRRINQEQYDLIHLHNIHGWYLDIPMLFRYIKGHHIPVIWTFHDCWPFTGQCPHFTMAKCDKWEQGCHHCPQYQDYPQSYVDQTKKMWNLKKKWFTGVEDMTIVTPSLWLADLVKQSFLREYPVKVINNGINLSIFKPTVSNFKAKHNIPETTKILLGVSFGWGKRKGLDVFIELSKRLNDDYKIVLVGTDDNTDKTLPSNIISIHRTQNQTELAEIYTAADLFVNPTREENYPTVNMEALACGTPVITFKTGGSPEIIDDSCGIAVDCDDIDGLETKIKQVCGQTKLSTENCLNRAATFDRNKRLKEYVELYKSIGVRLQNYKVNN